LRDVSSPVTHPVKLNLVDMFVSSARFRPVHYSDWFVLLGRLMVPLPRFSYSLPIFFFLILLSFGSLLVFPFGFGPLAFLRPPPFFASFVP